MNSFTFAKSIYSSVKIHKNSTHQAKSALEIAQNIFYTVSCHAHTLDINVSKYKLIQGTCTIHRLLFELKKSKGIHALVNMGMEE